MNGFELKIPAPEAVMLSIGPKGLSHKSQKSKDIREPEI